MFVGGGRASSESRKHLICEYRSLRGPVIATLLFYLDMHTLRKGQGKCVLHLITFFLDAAAI